MIVWFQFCDEWVRCEYFKRQARDLPRDCAVIFSNTELHTLIREGARQVRRLRHAAEVTLWHHCAS